MPQFTTDVNTQGFNASPIAPAENNVAAKNIAAFGQVAEQLGRAYARNSVPTGDAQNIDAVAPDETLVDPNAPTADQLNQIEELNTLSKIGAARKAGLKGDIARTRAEVLYRKAVSDNPLFADEIRKKFGEFYQTSFGSSFFTDPKDAGGDKRTPQQKGIDKAIEEMNYKATLANIPVEQYARYSANIEALNQKSNLIKGQQDVSEVDLISYSSTTSSETAMSLQGQIFEEMAATKGPLSPDRVKFYRQSITAAVVNLNKQWNTLVNEKGIKPSSAAIQRRDEEMRLLQQNLSALLDNSDNTKYVSENLSLYTDMIRLRSKQAHPEIHWMRETWGEQTMPLIMKGYMSPDFKAWATSNSPVARSLYNNVADPDLLKKTYFEGLAFMTPSYDLATSGVDPKAAAASAAIHLKDPKIIKDVSAEKRNLMVRAEPASISLLNTNKWSAAVNSGEVPVSYIEQALITALKTEATQYAVDNGSVVTSVNRHDSIKEVGLRDYRSKQSVRSYSDQNGNPLEGNFKQRLNQATALAERFPQLWEGKFDSKEAYVDSLFTAAKPKVEEAKPKEESVTLSPEQIRKLQFQQAKKEYPDLDDETINGILDGSN